MSLLITRPDYDLATKYLAHWSERIIDVAKSKGEEIIDLKGKKATRKELTGRIFKLNPALVVLNGHGDGHFVTGQDYEILIQAKENENMLYGRITYAVSCKCAKSLGPAAAAGVGTAFIGYDDDFVFTSDRKYLSRPLQDKRARPFMEASNHVAISLLKGHRASDASDRSKEMFKKSYTKLLSSESNPDALLDAKFLRWNMNHQVCLGKSNATI